MKQAVSSPEAPKAIGPYSQAVRAGQLLFVSGQVPLDPATGQLVEGDIAAQTRRVFANLAAVLKAGGRTFADVVRTTVFLADMNDFAAVNEVYGSYFSDPTRREPPCRSRAYPKTPASRSTSSRRSTEDWRLPTGD